MAASKIPYGNARSSAEVGRIVRARRKEEGLTQVEAASLCGVGTRFLSDLENGKATVELGKTLQVLAGLGLSLHVLPRGWQQDGSVR